MDGFKGYLTGSLQLRLSITLCSAIFIVAIASGCVTFFSALDEANELQDSILTQIVGVIKSAQFSFQDNSYISPALDDERGSNVIVQTISDSSPSSRNVPSYFNLPPKIAEGFHTISSPSGQYRVFVAKLSSTLRIVVGQKTAVRDEIALNSAWRTLMPFCALLPILLLIVTLLVRKIFKPVSQLASEVNHRDEQDLTPLAFDAVPNEVRQFIISINRLLSKVGIAMEAQRRFIADASHELRSPITALSLQAERLSQSAMSVEAKMRLEKLSQGINRSKKLLEQLLSLARVQQYKDIDSNKAEISIRSISRRVIENLLPLAIDKNIDIGVEANTDVTLHADDLVIFTIINNLVENAIKYTPYWGRVDLRFYKKDNISIIEVEDNGPGIALEYREYVFNPFYRIEGTLQSGSGLGLSIVQITVTQLGGKIMLLDSENYPSGLCVRITLPEPIM